MIRFGVPSTGKIGPQRALAAAMRWRSARRVGIGAGVSFLVVHTAHVALVSAAPAALVAAAKFICHIP
jgi:hypothetical protein